MKKITTRLPHKFQQLTKAVALICALGQAPAVWADQSYSYTYDEKGNVLTVDGPRVDVQDITTHTYNLDGTRATTTNALGHVTRYNAYDGAGRLISVTDPNGITTEFTYHVRGWLETVTVRHPTNSSLNAKTTYTYDAVGQLTRVTLPNGMATNYEYTDARQLKAVFNDLGERIEYELDAAGNRKKENIKNATGLIQYNLSRTFDELSRVMDITGNNGQNVKTTYDVNDNPRTQTNAKSHTTEQQYDALDRVKKVIDPNLKETAYTYDAQGNIQTVTDARGNVTRYDYDGLGNLKTLTSPDTGITQFTYDEAGNLKTRVDARGVETRYSYDALNRVTAVVYPASPTENVTFTYDNTANGNAGKGYLTGIQDPSGSSQLQYNYLGQLIQKNYTIMGVAYAQSYSYDLAGLLKQFTYPSGRKIIYARNSLGQITGITTQASGSTTTQTLMSNGQYLPYGPLQSMTLANGIRQSNEYDADYRLKNIYNQGPFAVLDQIFGYDEVDNLTSLTVPTNAGHSQSFSYDKLGRLETANNATYGNISFKYDDVGNRLEKLLTLGANTTKETYNNDPLSNRLNSVSSSINGGAATVRNFTYDQAGNPLTGVYNSLSTTLDYNDANRQEQMYIGSKPQVTLHNALGQRTSKAVMDKGINRIEHYHYDQSGQLIAVTNAAGAVLSEHVFFDGMPIAANLLTDTPLGVTLVSNDKIPNAGDAVVYTGIPQGGNGKIFEYRFRIKNTAGTWTTVRDWSGSDSYSWSVPTILGSYSVEVTARNQGSTASITTAATVNVVAPLAQTTKLSSSQLAPGASYTLTTTSTGGMLATAYQHRVRIKGPSTNNQYVVLRDWNSNNTFTAAMPTPLGAYTFEVCVLQYGTNANLACIYQGATVTTTPVTSLASQSASTKQVGTGWTLSTASNAGTPVLDWFVVHTDQLGTARALTNSAGKMVWRWFTQPFGEGAANTDVDGDGRSVTFNLRFPGQYFDWDTRLHYNYFRNYDVSTGRYIESDPIGLEGGINTYAYVGGNPLSFFDYLGLKPGDTFASPDDAAIDAGAYARTFRNQGMEYGGWIYRKGNCYTYNFQKGRQSKLDPKTLGKARPKLPIAIWHTHPNTGNPFEYRNEENFSGNHYAPGDGGDRGTSATEGVGIYLNTPRGKNLYYNYSDQPPERELQNKTPENCECK